MKSHNQILTTSLLFLATFVLLDLFLLVVVGLSIGDIALGVAITIPFALLFGYLIAQHTQIAYTSTITTLDNLIKESLHEIKIPIATIKANAQMLQKSQNEKDQKRAKRVLAATEKLENLYDELEYFMAKEVRPSARTIFNLKDLIEQKLDLFESRLDGWKIDQMLQDTIICADLFGFKKIIENLLDNAIKYSGANKELKIVLMEQKLSIQDRGIGIDPNKITEIFERYYQRDPSSEGHGIGLAIVKRVCDEHKIPLKLKSEKWTTITLDLAAVIVE